MNLDTLRRLQTLALRLVQTWWRPITCIGISGGAVVNLVVVPMIKQTPIDLMQAAAYVTACSAAFAVREVGKAWGTSQ